MKIICLRHDWLHYATMLFIPFLLIFYIGCTVAGYALGEGIDERCADPKAISLIPDSCACKKGDRVKLVSVMGDSFVGAIREIKPGEYILLKVNMPGAGPYRDTKVDSILWSNLTALTVLEASSTWRVVFTAVGAVMDLTIWAFIQTMRAWAAMGPS